MGLILTLTLKIVIFGVAFLLVGYWVVPLAIYLLYHTLIPLDFVKNLFLLPLAVYLIPASIEIIGTVIILIGVKVNRQEIHPENSKQPNGRGVDSFDFAFEGSFHRASFLIQSLEMRGGIGLIYITQMGCQKLKGQDLEEQISLLTDSKRMLRSRAAFNIGRCALQGQLDRRALKLLILLLQDADREVRMNSAFAVGEYASRGIFDEAAIKPLTKLLKDWSSKVRCRATTALGEYAKLGFYSTGIIKTLLRFLTDDDKELRANAGWTLGIYSVKDILEKNSSELIEKILETGDPNVKVGLSIALAENIWDKGQMKERFLEKFIELLSHKDPQIREGIAFVIGENAEEKQVDERILNPLLNLLNDPDPHVRANAVFALGAIAHQGVKTNYLIQKISSSTDDPDKNVKETAKNILQRLVLKKGSPKNPES